MRVLVSGASGMIGSAIRNALEERGDVVGALVRDRASSGRDVAWDPASGSIDEAALAAGEFDAVIHLAGENLLGRWTDDKQRRILDSRVDGTTILARAIAALERPPAVFAVASATGFYGTRGDDVLTEQSAPGTGFLADVVQAWEAAAEPARDAGIRTVHLRMAPVQSPTGGALKAQLLPYKLGAGGPVGNGRQWTPWIGLQEAVRMWLFAIDTQELSGAVNAVGPTPARSRDYAKALGRVLHRPAFMPAPVPIMKVVMGSELIEQMLLSSQKVAPARLEALEYDFLDRTIDDALRRELDR